MLHHYLKIALRFLNKNKGTSFINTIGLTVGLCTCLIIYRIVSYEFSYDQFQSDKDRIHRIVGEASFDNGDPGQMGFVPYALPKAVRDEIPGIESLVAFINIESKVKIRMSENEIKQFDPRDMGNDPAEIILAEPSYFDLFKYEWLAGNSEIALNEPYQLVLTESKAYKYFGKLATAEILGREVIYFDSLRVKVTGIVRDYDRPSDLTFTDFISFSTLPNSIIKNWINLNEWNDVWSASQAYVRLDPGSKREEVEGRLAAFGQKHFTGELKFKPGLQPLSDIHFNSKYADNYGRRVHLPTLYSIMGIAVFILIIACIDFINLSTAQAFQRYKEIGLRKVFGSQRTNLILQIITEASVLTLAGIVLSLMLAPQAMVWLKGFLPPGLKFELDIQTISFLTIILILTSILSGFYPAWRLTSLQPVDAIKGQSFSGTGEKGYVRKGLIVFQFTISLVFILGVLLVESQIRYMRNKDLGFNTRAVITLKAPRIPQTKTPVLYSKIRELSGIEDATLQIFEPMGQNFGLDRVEFQGTTLQKLDAAYKMGDEHFIPFYKMNLLAGRNLHKSDTARELVINETMVSQLGFLHASDVIGQNLKWRNKNYPIVGVVRDFHQQGMQNIIPPTFITTNARSRDIAFRLKDQDVNAANHTISQVEKIWKEIYPEAKFQYQFLDESISRFYEKERKTSGLVRLASGMAIFISMLGLFGLSTFLIARRSKEISIRKLLGATITDLSALLAREYLVLVALACLISFPVSYYFMRNWLKEFIYRVDISVWLFVIAGTGALLIVLFTVAYQSVRAARTNPINSLRSQ